MSLSRPMKLFYSAFFFILFCETLIKKIDLCNREYIQNYDQLQDSHCENASEVVVELVINIMFFLCMHNAHCTYFNKTFNRLHECMCGLNKLKLQNAVLTIYKPLINGRDPFHCHDKLS